MISIPIHQACGACCHGSQRAPFVEGSCTLWVAVCEISHYTNVNWCSHRGHPSRSRVVNVPNKKSNVCLPMRNYIIVTLLLRSLHRCSSIRTHTFTTEAFAWMLAAIHCVGLDIIGNGGWVFHECTVALSCMRVCVWVCDGMHSGRSGVWKMMLSAENHTYHTVLCRRFECTEVERCNHK